MTRTITLALALLIASSPAHAICFAPTEPFGGPPGAPPCSLSGSGFNRCSSWQIDSFKSEVENYIDKMQQYLEEAEDYAKCRVNEAIDAWNDFVDGY